MDAALPPAPTRRRHVHVVLPAFNEAACIARLLQHLDEDLSEAGLPYTVTVVDDGSTDDTAAAVRAFADRMPLTLMRHEVNQGLGATLRDGLVAVAERAAPRDILITMDADDTHTPGLILRMARMIQEGHDVVIASRYQPGSRTVGVPLHRRALSYFGSLLFRVVFPIRGVRDFTCGYRAYRAGVIQDALRQYGDAFLDQDGFQCMVDILLKLRRMNLIFGEVPFILRYDVKEGASKMNVGRTIRRTLTLMFRRKLGR
ncbi:MAG: hypothetical protein RLZZ303_1435 [Candidatus Hydrogenedentota bacterium]|jgi:dolichol-phosphate mannosyltransferase